MEYMSHLCYGAIAGSLGTVVSQPMFNWKVAVQKGKSNKQIIEQIKNRPYSESVRFFYNGWRVMMLGAAAEKTCVFGTYNAITKYNKIMPEDNIKMMIAGFCSGIVASIASTPTEQIVIDNQSRAPNNKSYKLSHLYKGFKYTMLRESVGFAVYVPLFEHIQYKYNKNNNSFYTLLNGVVTCTMSWIVVCPFDQLKTLKQSNQQSAKLCIYNLAEGYRGFRPAMMRALPFHVTTLYVYDYLRQTY